MSLKTVNITLKIDEKYIVTLENELKQFDLIDFKIIADTEYLYNNDEHFKSLVKKYKEAQKQRDLYINKHNK